MRLKITVATKTLREMGSTATSPDTYDEIDGLLTDEFKPHQRCLKSQ